jgi:hypothetical protein
MMGKSLRRCLLWMHSPLKAVFSPNNWMSPDDETGA